MKNLLIKLFKTTTLPVLMLLFTAIACNTDDSKSLKTENCPPDLEARKKMREQLISNEQVFNYYNNYSQNRTSILNEPLKEKYGNEFNDTRTVLFDFKVLKEYIKYVEEVSNKYGTTPEGIKVTFGVYPAETEYQNQSTVFFTPTALNDGRQSAYTIANDKLVYFKDLRQLPKIQKGGFMMFVQGDDEGLGLNGGQLIPPPNNDDPDFQ